MPHLFPSWWWQNEGALVEIARSGLFQPGLLIRWTAQNLLLSAPVWAADFLAGAAVLNLLERRRGGRLPLPLYAAAALALGAGLAGLAIFLTGAAGLLKPAAPAVLTALAGLAGAGVLARTGGWRRARACLGWLKPHRPGLWALALGALFGFLFLLLAADLMMPVLEFDSTMYHMRAARHYRETESLAYSGTIRYNAHPHLSVLLYLRHWSILGEDGPAKLENLEFLAILALVMVYAARAWRWPAGWPLAALFVLSSPLFLLIAHIEYADLALAAWLGAAAALLFHHLRRGSAAALVAGGLALGFAAAGKLQGLVLAACLLGGFAMGALAARRKPVAVLRALLLLGGLVALSGAGWWLRSWIHTGSPAFPFLAGGHPDAVATFIINRSYGLGHDWRAFLLLPWRMLTGPAWAFADATVFGLPGLLLIAAGLAALLRRRAWPAPEILFLATACAAYVGFWFATGQVMRYLTSILAPMAMLFVWALARAGLARHRRLAGAAIVLLAVPVVYESLLTAIVFRRGILPPVTYAQKEITLAGTLPYYTAVQEINRRATPSDKTYLLFCEECGYYLNTGSAGDWHGDFRYDLFRAPDLSAARMVDRLKRAGFRWVLVSRSAARRAAPMFEWPFADSAFVRPEVALPGGHAVYAGGGYAVFQLW